MHPIKYRFGSLVRFLEVILGKSDQRSAIIQHQIRNSSVVSIILSGDGGWRKFVRKVQIFLDKHNHDVLGIDMLLYCWQKKSNDQIVNDIATQLTKVNPQPKTVFIIGYSYGANIIPFICKSLDEKLEILPSYILLAPSSKIDFEIKLLSVIFDTPGKLDVIPQISNMPLDRTLIVTDNTRFSITKELVDHGLHPIEIAGGHHFFGHLDDVFDAMGAFINEGHQ